MLAPQGGDHGAVTGIEVRVTAFEDGSGDSAAGQFGEQAFDAFAAGALLAAGLSSGGDDNGSGVGQGMHGGDQLGAAAGAFVSPVHAELAVVEQSPQGSTVVVRKVIGHNDSGKDVEAMGDPHGLIDVCGLGEGHRRSPYEALATIGVELGALRQLGEEGIGPLAVIHPCYCGVALTYRAYRRDLASRGWHG